MGFWVWAEGIVDYSNDEEMIRSYLGYWFFFGVGWVLVMFIFIERTVF